jgi:hypothetical protein
MVTSIYGRRLGLSSTGGITQSLTSTGGISSSFLLLAQMWGPAMVATTTSTGGATLSNSGVSIINSSATSATFLVSAPVIGVRKEIYIISASSVMIFGGTSTSQVFMKVAGGAAGSTIITLTDASLAGQVLILRGLTATQWGVINGSTVIQT